MKKNSQLNRLAFRGGTYSLITILVVLAIVIAVNVLASALPSSATKFDISSSQLYSVTSNTKVVVNGLEQDVNIYWIVQNDEEDSIIENLLATYDSLSSHISIIKRNPDAYPTFAEQYTGETVANNSLIVECGERSRYIAYNELYLQEQDVYSYSSNISFDGEGAITSAIDYVTSEDLPMLYYTEGHGEAELPENLTTQLKKENIDTAALSLLTLDELPEDADGIMIYAPESDFSAEEISMLTEYVDKGGKLLVMAGPVESGALTNLETIITDYGVTVNPGIVLDTDRDHYAFGYPYILLPDMASGELTDPLINDNYLVIMPLAGGLTLPETATGGSVTEILTTSEESFAKAAGYDLETFEKEDGDASGPFAVAVTAEDSGGGRVVWFASSVFLDDMYNAYSSGANSDLTMNAISSLIGETESMAIRSKSLNYNYLTISDSTASVLKIVMIGICPLVYLGIGIAVVVYRRKKQNGAF